MASALSSLEDYEAQVHARLYHEFELRGPPVRAAASSAAFSGAAAVLDGAGRCYEEIAAGREAAAA